MNNEIETEVVEPKKKFVCDVVDPQEALLCDSCQ